MDDTSGPESRPRVAVVFGGRSSEHAISCVTAAGVLRALDREAWDVVPVGITRDGRWVLAADDPQRLEITDGALPEVSAVGPDVLVPLSTAHHDLLAVGPDQALRVLGGVDVVLPLLHGPYGEDGTVQGLLELGDVRYVGSGVLSSAVAMDKHFMKLALAGAGLPVGRYTVILPRDWERDPGACRSEVEKLGLPVFVKPARGGSSVGISKVSDLAGLDDAIELARQHDPKVVVEAAVVGREIECGVLERLDGGDPEASLPGEITVTGTQYDFYDFDAKYLAESGTVDLSCPADLPDEVTAEVRALAVRAFTALGCEGLGRVDLFYTDDGQLVVNEVNTMPGFTPTSMFPLMWRCTGVEYPELLDRLLRLALARRTGLR